MAQRYFPRRRILKPQDLTVYMVSPPYRIRAPDLVPPVIVEIPT